MIRSIQHVRKAMTEQGRTRRWLAQKCGITVGHLSHILLGRRNPSLSVLKLMVQALGLPEALTVNSEAEEVDQAAG